ncbi:RUN and FYVE domain-containing protein 4 [Pelodiscus sinensis]|uniref:RUN and FYVE domain-containing protein 4 n=1 Tax=Pelodiscus sinensis TaxID=13735 RepID=UPI003F6C4096
MAGAGELLRVIQDLRSTVRELRQSYKERSLPVTDGSRELHRLCAQLEFLLQFDLKEKRSFFGQRRDYWDFLCQGLASQRQGHEGVRFVSSLEKLRTPVGKGRSFLRYCLVHRQLAESLQLCFLDPQTTSEWYYARSPFLHPHLRADVMGCLYELDGIAFHLALRRADLDAAWPMASETLLRPASHSPVGSQEGTGWPVGSPAGDCGTHAGASKGPQEGLGGQSPELHADGQLQPTLEEPPVASLDDGKPRSWVVAGEGMPEAELWRANAQLQLQVEALGRELQCSLAAARDLESRLAQQEQRHGEERERLRQEAVQRCSQAPEPARRLREQQDSWGDRLEEVEPLRSAPRQQLARREEETASLEAGRAQEPAELEARLAEGERCQQERLSQAPRDAEREAAAAASQHQAAQASAQALEEAERRLRALEAERRRHLAEAEAQELRQEQLLLQSQRLQEKLRVSEERLEEKEAQLAALQSQLSQTQQGEPGGRPPLSPEDETSQRVESRLRQAELQAVGLREKLERGLLERRELEKEREALLESAVSQGQSLAAARLETEELRKELAGQQEQISHLQAALERAEGALAHKEAEVRGLQRELEGQSAKLRDALSGSAALASQLAEAAAGRASEKAQQEARGTEHAGRERAGAELRGRLAEGEEQMRMEREALVGQAQATAAAGESREVAQLRAELQELRARSQREETRLQEALATAQGERDRLARQEEESDGLMLALRRQVQELGLEKGRAAAELEQVGGGRQPHAGEEEPGWLARGSGAVEEKAAGAAGPPTEDLRAVAPREKASPERTPRKGDEKTVKHLTASLEKALGEAQQKAQLLKAKEEAVKHLEEQLGRARQDGERLGLALQQAQREAEERDRSHRGQLAEQQELVRDMKGRLLELLREKDALWQKTEGIHPQAPAIMPRGLGLCARCSQAFGCLSRKFQCRLCQGTVCQACSVRSGRWQRCCLLCWQKRNFKGT